MSRLIPDFISQGGGATTGSPVVGGWPATENKDVALLVVRIPSGRSVSSVSNFSSSHTLYSAVSNNGDLMYAYLKICDGTETGNISVAISGGVGGTRAFRVFTFRNVDWTLGVASLYEGLSNAAFGSGTTWNDQGVTTNDVSRLAVNVCVPRGNISSGGLTGESGGNWTEVVDVGAASPAYRFIAEVSDQASSGTINGGSATLSGTVDGWVMGLALIGIEGLVVSGQKTSTLWRPSTVPLRVTGQKTSALWRPQANTVPLRVSGQKTAVLWRAQAETTIAEDIDDTDTDFLLTTVVGLPATPFDAWITNTEIVTVTSVGPGNSVHVTRGVAGTPGAAHANGHAFKEVRYKYFSSAITGSSSGVGALGVARSLSGAADGSSSAAGTLSKQVEISGQADGSSAAEGTLSNLVSLSGSADGSSAAEGTLFMEIGLSGSADGSSAAEGTLETEHVSPRPPGSGSPWPTLLEDIWRKPRAKPLRYVFLSGKAEGSSAASGTLSVARALSGKAAGRTSVSAFLGVARSLSGRAGGRTKVGASLNVDYQPPLWMVEELDEDLVDLEGQGPWERK